MSPSLENQSNASCPNCKKASVVSHNGGQWCSLCGEFGIPPDKTAASGAEESPSRPSPFLTLAQMPHCASCFQPVDPDFGIYDDGEWTCGFCLSRR